MQLEGQTLLAFVALALMLTLAGMRAGYWRGYARGLQDGQLAGASRRMWQDILEHVTGHYSLVPDALIDGSVAVPRTLVTSTDEDSDAC